VGGTAVSIGTSDLRSNSGHDVGGGNGTFLAGLLFRYGHLAAFCSTSPTWCLAPPVGFVSTGVGERAEVVAGDFSKVLRRVRPTPLNTVLPG
jgi:hypothetical protein